MKTLVIEPERNFTRFYVKDHVECEKSEEFIGEHMYSYQIAGKAFEYVVNDKQINQVEVIGILGDVFVEMLDDLPSRIEKIIYMPGGDKKEPIIVKNRNPETIANATSNNP